MTDSVVTKAPPKVTLIMPAYNAEKYIENTISSIQLQSYENFELIVVNDGSKDSTESIISSLAAKDARIRLISVQNGGPAMARNCAIDSLNPETQFIMFIDADDALKPDAIMTALNAAESGADMVIFGFTIVNQDGTHNDYFEKRMSLSYKQFGNELVTLYKANLLNQVWGKLFRADLIIRNALRFPNYRWGEDRLFVYDCLELCQRIEILPDCNYLYLMHEGESLITKFYDKKLEICFEAYSRMEELIRVFDAPENGYFGYMFIKSVLSCMTTLFSPSCKLSFGEKLRYVRGILEDERVRARCRNVSGGMLIKIICAVMLTKLPLLNLAMVWAMTAVGKIAPKLFLKLKHRK